MKALFSLGLVAAVMMSTAQANSNVAGAEQVTRSDRISFVKNDAVAAAEVKRVARSDRNSFYKSISTEVNRFSERNDKQHVRVQRSDRVVFTKMI